MPDDLTIAEMDKRLIALRPARVCVGIVVRPELEALVKQHFTQVPNRMASCLGVPLYTDAKQEEECLLFFNRNLLIAYLSRNEEKPR